MQQKVCSLILSCMSSADDIWTGLIWVKHIKGGISMGERDYYLENDDKTKEIRKV